MTLSGPHLGVMPSVCRSQPESGSDTAPVHTAASQRSRTDAADPRTVVSNINPGEAESNSDIRQESEFDAAGFVEFAERHLEWLDRVDSAEARAWHEGALTPVLGHAESSICWGSEMIFSHVTKELLGGVPAPGGRVVRVHAGRDDPRYRR